MTGVRLACFRSRQTATQVAVDAHRVSFASPPWARGPRFLMEPEELPEDVRRALLRSLAAGNSVHEPSVRSRVQAALQAAGLGLRQPQMDERVPAAMYVLFLDLDGCVHGATEGEYFAWVDPLLQLLDEFPDVAVVIHSGWRRRYGTDKELRAKLPSMLARRVIGATSRSEYRRQDSIEAYIAEHRPAAWVVVDDEPRLFKPGFPLVACDPERGLSDPVKVQKLREALMVAAQRWRGGAADAGEPADPHS